MGSKLIYILVTTFFMCIIPTVNVDGGGGGGGVYQGILTWLRQMFVAILSDSFLTLNIIEICILE